MEVRSVDCGSGWLRNFTASSVVERRVRLGQKNLGGSGHMECVLFLSGLLDGLAGGGGRGVELVFGTGPKAEFDSPLSI